MSDQSWLVVAAGVQAVSAVVIAVLTWRLARSTKQYATTTNTIAKLAAQSLVLESLPVVVASPGGGNWNGNSGTRQVVAENTGGGTALNVQLRLEATVALDRPHSEQVRYTFVLGAGERSTHDVRTDQRTIYDRTDNFRCVADYQDILANRYRTRREPDGALSMARVAPDGSESIVTLI